MPALAQVVLATLLSYPVGLLLDVPFLLPVLNTAPAYVLMARRLREGRRGEAVTAMLAWAACLAVFGTVIFAAWPTDPGPRIWNGPEYREEMFRWIRTGEGSESRPSLFLPRHVLHLAVFVALSLLTASAVSMVGGAVLMNYMDYYVASLARAGAPAWATVLLGWQPWAICRVAAFVTLGVALAEPLLHRLLRYPYAGLGSGRRLIVLAAGGIVADWVLKAALAPFWERWLRAALP